jgi:hypothetical protein
VPGAPEVAGFENAADCGVEDLAERAKRGVHPIRSPDDAVFYNRFAR